MDTIANELNAETDALNALYAELEETLRSFRFGVEAHVLIEENDFLAFCKLGDSWRLCHCRQYEDGLETSPLASASRAVRIRASLVAGQLLEELRANAARATIDVQTAQQHVRAAVIAAQKQAAPAV